MKTKLMLLGVALLAGGLAWAAPVPTQAYPAPATAPRVWQLDFTHAKPRTIGVKGPAGDTSWYWYVTYKVVNRTESERLFVPEATLATDTGDIMPSSRIVPPAVFDAIKSRSSSKLLESPTRVAGRLLVGEDGAKESVIVWPVLHRDVREVKLFIAGLSGESEIIQNPATGKDETLRKTLMVTYATPVANQPSDSLTMTEKSRTWVMR